MARWDRRTRLTAMLGLRDETKRGLASASRGFQTYLSGNSRAAGMAGMAVSGALSGHAAFAAAGIGASFLTMAGTSISAFIEVEKKWAEVTTLMPQLNDDALGMMKKQIDQFARESGTTLTDAYDAAYQAVSAGIDPASTASFLETAHRAALAGVTDVTTAVDGLTSVINAYGLEVENAAEVSDAMFTAIRLGKTTFREMAPVLGPVLPIASSMNTEFKEITAALAALTAQGVPTAIAMTQIRSALVALSKETKAKTIFEGVMGMTYSQFQEQGGTLREALKAVVDETDRTGQSLAQAFGRIEGANAALALSSERGAEVYEAAMLNMVGATDAAYNRMAETTDFQVRKWKAEWEAYKTWFGQDFVEMMSAAYGNFNDLLATFGVGMTMEEKEILEQSERNWKNYAQNQQTIFNTIEEGRKRILMRELGGGFQPGPIPGVPTAPPRTQAGPGSVGEWLFGVSGFGAGGGDAGALGRMNERAANILMRNLQDLAGYGVHGGGGGGGGVAALRDNTDALNALREQLEEEMERNRQLEVAPGEVPVLPEFLQASELRYISRMVQNKLVGGVVS